MLATIINTKVTKRSQLVKGIDILKLPSDGLSALQTDELFKEAYEESMRKYRPDLYAKYIAKKNANGK